MVANNEVIKLSKLLHMKAKHPALLDKSLSLSKETEKVNMKK